MELQVAEITFMKNSKKKQNRISDNFLEAFRDTGATLKKSIQRPPKQTHELAQFPAEQWKNREAQIRSQERTHARRIIQQEKLVYSRKQEELKKQITAIQHELKLLVSEAGLVSIEVETAVQNIVVNPGVYHVNFFEKIRQLLVLLRKQVEHSNTWMQETNAKAAKRTGYWGKVKKGGTKFMLSQERTIATQSG